MNFLLGGMDDQAAKRRNRFALCYAVWVDEKGEGTALY